MTDTRPEQPQVQRAKTRAFGWAYEGLMAALAIATIWMAVLPPTPEIHTAIWAIWIVFLADYLVRLLLAPKKFEFVRRNVADLLAILPIDYFRSARLLRLLRLLRVIRGMEVLWRVSATVRGVLRTNRLGYVMLSTLAIMVAGGFLINQVEPGIATIHDGMWWSLVTATTVGYGDISPKTGEGRVIAAVLMLVGIGTIGMITGSIATYFLGTRGASNPHVSHIQRQLDRWDEMTGEERREVVRLLESLVSSEGRHPRQ